MSVSAYNPILIAECSPNLVTAGVQEFPNKTLQMMIDTQDKGICSISELQKRTSGSQLELKLESWVMQNLSMVIGCGKLICNLKKSSQHLQVFIECYHHNCGCLFNGCCLLKLLKSEQRLPWAIPFVCQTTCSCFQLFLLTIEVDFSYLYCELKLLNPNELSCQLLSLTRSTPTTPFLF